jgi:hypothetical protein
MTTPLAKRRMRIHPSSFQKHTFRRAFSLIVVAATLACFDAANAAAAESSPASSQLSLAAPNTGIPQPARYGMFLLGGAVLLMMKRGWHRS